MSVCTLGVLKAWLSIVQVGIYFLYNIMMCLLQDLLALEAIRSSLREQLGREPALIEWAGAVDMAVGSFSSRLHEGRQSKDRMIQSNLRLVVSVANKYQGKGMSFEDLVQVSLFTFTCNDDKIVSV